MNQAADTISWLTFVYLSVIVTLQFHWDQHHGRLLVFGADYCQPGHAGS